MSLLSALSRSGRGDGESRLRRLDRAGRSFTYLTIAFDFYGFPLTLVAAAGSPIRAVGIVDD